MAQPVYDAIVVGSGATGGWAAKELTEKGLRVIMLEAGRKLDPAKDYKMLAWPYDLKHRNLVPPTELLDHLYGTEDGREANAVEAVITRMRRKLGSAAIETRRGFGYRLGGDP